ncbi:hypothetical protein ACFL6U_03575 [Planctomycetota bacterium]
MSRIRSQIADHGSQGLTLLREYLAQTKIDPRIKVQAIRYGSSSAFRRRSSSYAGQVGNCDLRSVICDLKKGRTK